MRLGAPVVRRALAASGLGLLLAALAPAVHSAPPSALAISPETVVDVAGAKSALDAIEAARRQQAADRPGLQEACRRRVLVNACLAELDEQRRAEESRLKILEVRAKTVLREDRAARAHASEAERLQQRDAGAEARTTREEAGRHRREERESRAQERSDLRPAQEAEHAARAARWEARNRVREEDLARRARDREQREREAPGRAAAHAERLEQNEVQVRDRRARAQEREAKEPSR